MKRFIRLVEILNNVSGYLSALLVLFSIGLIAVHVFARRVLNSPLLFGEEVSCYLLLWMTFLGLAYTMKTGGHVRVDVFVRRFSDRSKLLFHKLPNILGILFTLIFLAGNFLMLRQFYLKHTLSTKDLQIPLVIPAIVLVIGPLLLLFQMIVQLSGLEKKPLWDKP